jgi:hypothetical protein
MYIHIQIHVCPCTCMYASSVCLYVYVHWRIHLCDMTHLSFVTWPHSFSWDIGWQRYMKCLIFVGHFQTKRPSISGAFAGSDLWVIYAYTYILKYMYIYIYLHIDISVGQFLQMYAYICVLAMLYAALAWRSLSVDAPFMTRFFCGKCPVQMRHPMV